MSELQPHHNASSRFSAVFIDRILWEVAAAGGNVRRAYTQLERWAVQQLEDTGEMPDIPSERTVRDWVANRYRNRYHEVQQAKVTEMDERLAQDGQRLAVQMADAQERALKQSLAGLSQTNAVDAANILRNIAVAQKANIDNSINLRRQQGGGLDGRTLNDLVGALVRGGGVKLAAPLVEEEEDVVDAEVVEG